MNAEYEQIHDAVRLDPESVWDRLSLFICASAAGPAPETEWYERADLIEDLMFWHADSFIDRLERLIHDCPGLQVDVVMAHVGGVAPGHGLERFYELQELLASELEAKGGLTRWKGGMPLNPTDL